VSDYILGIDQGTSQTKALIMGRAGQVLAANTAAVKTTVIGETRIEQDPFDILRSVELACAPLLEQYPAAIAGLDNQGETFLLWDARSGEPMTPAISWQDKRGAAICQELEAAGHGAVVRQRTGLLLDPYFSASKLAQVLRESPELAQRAAAGELRFGTVDTWLIWQLSAERLHITDPSTASRTLLYNIHTLAWDDDLLALFGIPAVLLPRVAFSGGLSGEIALGGRALALHGMLCDQQAALFGQGCLGPGSAKCTFGTGAFLLLNTGAKPVQSDHGLLSTVAWQTQALTHYALDGGVFVAGAAVEWLRDELGIIASAAESDALAQAADPATTPLYIPALAGLAAPYWQPQARGTMFGLSRGSGRAEFARATLEGLAQRVTDVLLAMQEDAGLQLPILRVDGGPARNRFLMQTLTDNLGAEVQVAAEVESTATGVAHMARHAAHGVSLDAIAASWRAAEVYTPQISAGEREERRARWQRAVALAMEMYAIG
jgi:glycerol kinase